MNETVHRFQVGERYFSDDNHEMTVHSRSKEYIRVAVGFGLPANYKIKHDFMKREWVKAKGHVFTAK